MTCVLEVAKYILVKQGEMTSMKLQKLVYYAQAWSLAWQGEVLFQEEIQAWAKGPIVPKLFWKHQGMFKVDSGLFGDVETSKLSESQKDVIDSVLDIYAEKTGFFLSELTHQESPWKDAREGLEPSERSNVEITPLAMRMYYSNL